MWTLSCNLIYFTFNAHIIQIITSSHKLNVKVIYINAMTATCVQDLLEVPLWSRNTKQRFSLPKI